MSTDTTPGNLSASATSRPLLAVRWLSLLSTLNVLCQGITAGEVLMKNHTALEFHAAGAIVLHVFTGLAAIAAGLHWRATRGSVWPAALAVVLFVATFVQAAFGHGRTLYIHVPLALFILLGLTWLTAWAWLATRSAARTRLAMT
ncbi:MAG TPA: hypothetical protein VH008_16245 [Pseudonocardia sp.]|nr:hypothetical protein [Pseudonocardia sp.]